MFRPTPQLCSRIRRLPLTTKQVNKGYYKGNRTGSMGRHTKHGKYIIDYGKVRTYCVPELSEFPLTPFVATRIKTPRGSFDHALLNEARSQGKDASKSEGNKIYEESSSSDRLMPPLLSIVENVTKALQAPHERFGGRLDARRYLAVWRNQNTSEVNIVKGKRA